MRKFIEQLCSLLNDGEDLVLAIEADTPEEIAVSIVGELIYQRATGRKAWHLV